MPSRIGLPRSQIYHLRHGFGMTFEAIGDMFGVSYSTIRRKLKPDVDKSGRCVDCGKAIDYRGTRCRKCSAPIKKGIFPKGEGHPYWGGREKTAVWLGGDVEIECRGCGIVFKVRPYNTRQFCTSECKVEFNRLKRLRKRTCKNCGKPFEFDINRA